MKLIARNTDGSHGEFSLVSDVLRKHLVDWYQAAGDEHDHKLAVNLVHNAKKDEQWIACDCLGDGNKPPLLSPAYLSLAGTFYLRRLTNEHRPEHHEDCPFFREQTPFRLREKNSEVTPHKLLDGYFAILKPEIMKLAQAPDDAEPDDRARREAVPRLAKLLWTIMDRAQLNQSYSDLNAEHNLSGAASLYERLRQVGRDIEMAPGIFLKHHLHVNIGGGEADLNRIYADLRSSEKIWPEGHAAQSFAIVAAKAVKGHIVTLVNGEKVEIKNRVIKPTIYGTSTAPPFLVIILFGQYSPKIGMAPIRAYAQSVIGEADFVPVDSDFERQTALSLRWFKDKLSHQHVQLDFQKPVFDIKTKSGLCRPDFIVTYINSKTGTRRKFILETMGFDTEEYLDSKARTIERMKLIAPVHTVTKSQLENGEMPEILMKAV